MICKNCHKPLKRVLIYTIASTVLYYKHENGEGYCDVNSTTFEKATPMSFKEYNEKCRTKD